MSTDPEPLLPPPPSSPPQQQQGNSTLSHLHQQHHHSLHQQQPQHQHQQQPQQHQRNNKRSVEDLIDASDDAGDDDINKKQKNNDDNGDRDDVGAHEQDEKRRIEVQAKESPQPPDVSHPSSTQLPTFVSKCQPKPAQMIPDPLSLPGIPAFLSFIHILFCCCLLSLSRDRV